MTRRRNEAMANSGEPPAPENEAPMERFLRFGTALFAVKKDELPKRDERKKAPRKKPKPA